MATIFLGYQRNDRNIATVLERHLTVAGHTIKNPQLVRFGDDWRVKLDDSLSTADVAVFVLTEDGLRSPYVLQKLGFSRALKRVRQHLPLGIAPSDLDPARPGGLDYYWYEPNDPAALERVAGELVQRLAEGNAEGPRIFISHRHADAEWVSKLVSLLEAAFEVRTRDLRCTSVPPFMLSGGDRTSDRLRSDINAAEVVIGVIGPEVGESQYVLFELGASWGRGAMTVPVLIRGAKPADIPGPLAEHVGIKLDSADGCLQLIDDVAARITLKRRENVGRRLYKEAEELVRLTAAASSESVKLTPSASLDSTILAPRVPLRVVSRHIDNYFKAQQFSRASFERIREKIDDSYSDGLLQSLIDLYPQKYRHVRLAGGLHGIGLALKKARSAG